MSISFAQMLVQFLVVGGVVFFVLAVVYSLCKFEKLARPDNPDFSTQTLAPRDVFSVRLAARLGLWRSETDRLTIALLQVLPGSVDAPVSGADLVRDVDREVRKKDDEALALGPGRAGLILGCSREHFPRIQARLEKRLGVPLQAALAEYSGRSTRAEDLVAELERTLKEHPVRTEAYSPADSDGPVAPGSVGAASPNSPGDSRILDSLTGVLRSDRVPSAALKFMAQWRRKARKVSLIVLDFDHLAEMNKRYGQEAGDNALRSMGQLLETSVRESDLIGRMEDDEFLVLVPGDGEIGLRIARRLLDRYARAPFVVSVSRVRGTVSAGVAEAPRDAHEFHDLLLSARLALARGRRMGRGRCTRFHPDMKKTRDGMRLAPHDHF